MYITMKQYIDNLIFSGKWDDCYNQDKKAVTGGGFDRSEERTPWNKGKKNVYSKATLRKISAALQGKKNPNWGRPRSKETREKISKANKGKNNGMYGKFGKKHPRSKPYAFISPDGEIVTGVSLSNFCKINDLQQSKMWAVLHEKRNHHKGWKKYKEDK